MKVFVFGQGPLFDKESDEQRTYTQSGLGLEYPSVQNGERFDLGLWKEVLTHVPDHLPEAWINLVFGKQKIQFVGK